MKSVTWFQSWTPNWHLIYSSLAHFNCSSPALSPVFNLLLPLIYVVDFCPNYRLILFFFFLSPLILSFCLLPPPAGPVQSRGSCVLEMQPDAGGVRRPRCFTSSHALCRFLAESPPTWTKPPSWESPSASCGCVASCDPVRSSATDGQLSIWQPTK